MRRYIIGKSLIITVVATTFMALCVSWMGRIVVAQLNDATGDRGPTVEQCIGRNTDASIKPVEKILIEAGLVEEQLGSMAVTEEMCTKILARTPDGSPVERIIAAGNVIQELDAIQKSMNEAVDGDVNGDGVVNAQDAKTASVASYAASHTAHRAIGTAINEEGSQVGVIEEINAVPAVYLQNTVQDQYGDEGGGGVGAEDGFFRSLPSQEQVQDEAASAAQDKGASPKAATAGGNCAAKVALVDRTYLRVVDGMMAFEAPAKEMVWKARDVTELLMSPAASTTLKNLKQRLRDTEGASEIKGRCIPLATKMRAELIGSQSAFAITPLVANSIQDIALAEDTGWKWEIVASSEGTHRLTLVIEMLSAQGEKARGVARSPFDDDIIVKATLWQRVSRLAGNNWQFFLAPFLAPIAFYTWRKYKQRSNEHEEQGSV